MRDSSCNWRVRRKSLFLTLSFLCSLTGSEGLLCSRRRHPRLKAKPKGRKRAALARQGASPHTGDMAMSLDLFGINSLLGPTEEGSGKGTEDDGGGREKARGGLVQRASETGAGASSCMRCLALPEEALVSSSPLLPLPLFCSSVFHLHLSLMCT